MNSADAVLSGVQGSVGAMQVNPRYVGAAVRPNYVGAPVSMVAQGQMGEQPVEYAPTTYVAGNLSFFGFGITSIPANDTLTIQLNPVRPIAPQKLFCPSTVVDLLIDSASIGGTNLFAGSEGIPIEIFSEVSTSKPLNWTTITPAVGIVFAITNPTAGALNFTGGIYGTTVRT